MFEFHAFQKEIGKRLKKWTRNKTAQNSTPSHIVVQWTCMCGKVFGSCYCVCFFSVFMNIFARMYGPFDHLGIQQIHSESALLARIHAQKYTHTNKRIQSFYRRLNWHKHVVDAVTTYSSPYSYSVCVCTNRQFQMSIEDHKTSHSQCLHRSVDILMPCSLYNSKEVKKKKKNNETNKNFPNC